MKQYKKERRYRFWTTFTVLLLYAGLSAFGIYHWLTSGVRAINEGIQSTIGEVKTVVSDFSVTDSDVKVYGYKREIKLNGENAEVQTTVGKIAQNTFIYQEDVDYAIVEGLKGEDVFSLNLLGVFFEYEVKDNLLTGTIKAKDIDEFFGIEDAKAQTDATVTLTLDGEKLVGVTVTYGMVGGKEVNLTVTYAY